MLSAVREALTPYLIVLGLIWIASVGVPIPEDIALLGGGLACYKETATIPLMIVVAMFAVLSGDSFIFFLGRKWSSNLLEHRLTRKMATPERVEQLRDRFNRHQLKTVFVGRFMPGMRVLVFLTAGAMGMRYWRFLLSNGTAALISVPFFIVLGHMAGEAYDRVEAQVKEVKYFIVLGLIAAAAIYVLYLQYSKSARAKEAERLLKLTRDKPEMPSPAVRVEPADGA